MITCNVRGLKLDKNKNEKINILATLSADIMFLQEQVKQVEEFWKMEKAVVSIGCDNADGVGFDFFFKLKT